ncbi:MAG TPA: ATP-dependent DNA helicase RecG [Candidatus Hydrogenedentes bacterium]|nr:ATP-dependent DNA helicase RecG [Candidatus Hydrogenedentota bacterium]HPG67436.1 ATP-dependent DNA helicase RecG [Candidatus Hydrogenedentota bacterium]
MLSLDDSIAMLPGIGPKRSGLLANLGVATVRDLLFHLPRDYQDRRDVLPIAQAAQREGDLVTVQGEIVSARSIRLRRNMSLAVVSIRDDTGRMNVTFFGRGFLAKTFVPGASGIFTGTVGNYQGPALKNPEYEMLSGDEEDRLNTGRVVPIYRLTQKVTQRMLRRWIAAALDAVDVSMEDPLPALLRARYEYPPVFEALREAHFPAEIEAGRHARTRFAYEELLGIQLGILAARQAHLHEETGIRHAIDGPCLGRLRAALPFTLTEAQQRVVNDVLEDMASPRPMFRLLQGDVGCGKTVVALHGIAAARDGGYQTALMAPTEVLAEQHFITLRDWLEPVGIRVGLLTGAIRGAASVRREIALGHVDVVVGTHAIIQEATRFHRLGLAVVDEQHRFGVVQRGLLAEKGQSTDILQMTATPIPRTLAITVYGGMDISVIDQLPPGRQPIKTRHVPAEKVADLYRYIAEQAAEGYQTYLICPLVEESDKKDLTAVTSHFEALSEGPLADLRTALIHGRLGADEKDAVMHRFKRGEVDVLFSTTVIEVGIDVPNATTMVIEDAAQFGLTQLHQLRGRVGRGDRQSHCFLVGAPTTKEGKRRIEVLCKTNSGFEIAEEDLVLRGPGEFYGVRQAGLTDLRVADLIRDARLLDAARRDAQAILAEDPTLSAPEHRHLAQIAQQFTAGNA